MGSQRLSLTLLVVAAFTAQSFALPQFASRIGARSGVEFSSNPHFEARATNGLLGDVTAIINAIPTSFNLAPVVSVGRKVIPDAAHPFMPPGPTDVRGGCPGLNLLANYGYLPRNGITDMTTLLYASEEGLGMAPDFALILVAFALKTCVDLTTLKMSIGDTDARTDGPLTPLLGRAPGLFSPATHNEYEEDEYNGTMPLEWNGDVRFMEYNLCRNLNPQCHWAVVDQLAFYMAQALVPSIMPSSGPNGLPGPPLADSINEFMGIVKHSDGTFTRGNERLPHGPEGVWFRRTVPLTGAEFAANGAATLAQHPVQFGSNGGTLGNWNADPTHLPNVIAGPELACTLLKSALDPTGTRFQGVAQTSLNTLLKFVLAPVQNQLGC
ncbi:uncharacterized protein MELLADRAFT_112688 [Melampsora larici-populina 98AG31]|uniref:Heme haloperoxidase family profile domain-containing protein n=1 Tax=Melampsora larici-populina (strain 98AG31 / pathotype 3-4-7) TaxID=747676 RepID=F4S799_MELLP|nr:uncharacterized protein MELLADRAFT_112688 [Melampsora larici-populina 98AG31]EGF99479.1 hypothetical protein MELLADRAFT_112688 [Melampsora larici-populina 98AG31]